MRKMASVQKILNIRPIPGADAIEAVDVQGWTVVSQKGIHAVGDLVIYYEIDSWLSADDPRYASFEERFGMWGEKRGMRLKSIKLRKQLSQGLIMSLTQFPEIKNPKEGDDVTEILKIEKWESLHEANSNNGGAQGAKTAGAKPWPSFLRKTDQERIQNYLHAIPDFCKTTFEATIKLDGSSMTVFHLNDSSPIFESVLDEMEEREMRRASWFQKAKLKLKKLIGLHIKPKFIQGVCSRNIQLSNDGDNHFTQFVLDNGIFESLKLLNMNIAVQGELIGPAIQNNFENCTQNEYYVYDVFDINKQDYFKPSDSQDITQALSLNYVPVLAKNLDLRYLPGTTHESNPREIMDAILKYAEGEGLRKGVKREGVVFKSNVGPHSFKAISNSYLLAKDKK